MNCNICNSPLAFFYNGNVLNKYSIEYFKCTSCGFIQTEKPYWLNEAYNNVIAQLDIGLVSRNLELAADTEKILLTFFNNASYCIDYGGGYGLFVRLMRDKGFQFYRYDTYCQNIFALHFDFQDSPTKKFEILTAFEVFEHLADPIDEISKMLEMSDTLIFSTIIAPASSAVFDNWWYRAPLSGQHVSFYSIESLKFIAKKHGKHFYSNNHNLHIITSKELDNKVLNNIFFPPKPSLISRIANRLSGKQSNARKKSLLEADYKFIEKEIVKQVQS